MMQVKGSMFCYVFTSCKPFQKQMTFCHAQHGQELYKNDPRIWNALFERLCQDFGSLEQDGIDLGFRNGHVFPIVIGNKGDWVYLVPGS